MPSPANTVRLHRVLRTRPNASIAHFSIPMPW